MNFATIGQVLSLIGMAPVKHGNSTVIEKKRAAKSMFPRGDISSLITMIMSGKVSQLFTNPMGQLTSQLTSIIPQVLASVSPTLNGVVNPQFTALSSLSGAISSITSLTNSLSGVTQPISGQFGFLDVLSHAETSSLLGSTSSDLSLASVLAPLTATTQLTAALNFLSSSVTVNSDNSITAVPANGNTLSLATIQQHTNTLFGLVATSTSAVSGLQDLVTTVSNVAAVTNALSDATTSSDALNFINTVVTTSLIPAEPAIPTETIST